MANRRILIIDDDLEIFHAFKTVLSPSQQMAEKEITRLIKRKSADEKQDDLRNFDLSYASQGEEGYSLLCESLEKGEPFAVAFIDVRMPPGWDGVKTATLIREKDPNIEIVIVTAFSDRSQDEILKSVGTPEKLLFFKKPFDLDEVLQLAISLTEKWNITEKEKQIKAELQASQERYCNLVEAITDWVYELDTVGNFTYCSPVCKRLLGFEASELVGEHYCQLLKEDECKYFSNHLKSCLLANFEAHTVERTCMTKDGEEVSVESSFTAIMDRAGSVVGFRGIDRDITSRKKEEEQRLRMENQLRQVQKLEALGSLAGGIAHDFNNVLSPILGFSQLCMMKMAEDDPSYKYVEIIEVSANKASDLVRQILGFARNSETVFHAISLNPLVEKFSKMLKRLLPENIALTFEYGDNLGMVRGDNCQLEQILLNLVVNARDALGGQNGKIHVTTWNAAVTEEQSIKDVHGHGVVGSFVVMSVSDNGSGIPPETVEKIFEPFFTTKDVGKGTGIGLATIASIVEQYKGHICLETGIDEGTTFHVYFPETAQIEVLADETREAPEGAGDSETILLAEDDSSVRAVVSSVLKDYGYNVLEAKFGSEAMEIYKSKADEIDLLITDVVMPGYGGVEVATMVREMTPTLPIIFISGYPLDLLPESVSNAADAAFISKPCLPHEILAQTKKSLQKASE